MRPDRQEHVKGRCDEIEACMGGTEMGGLNISTRGGHMHRSAQSWYRFRRVVSRASRLDEMMGRLGVDKLAAIRKERGSNFKIAVERCINCRYGPQCGRWLDASIVLSEPPPFCANAHFLEEFRRRAGPAIS
jgi:hypothetical protein